MTETNTNTQNNREAWLVALTGRLAPMFAAHGYPLPDRIRVTCGLPSKNALNGAKKQTIGQCWDSDCSADQHFEIMVSPVKADPMTVATVLAHELVHAAVGLEHGHKGPFKRCATRIGLEGKMTSTTAGALFVENVQPMLDAIGPYPHAALDARGRSSGAPKQDTRNLKCTCPDCGYTVRTTMKWLTLGGPPICPIDEIVMQQEEGA